MISLLDLGKKAVDQFSTTENLKFRCQNNSQAKLLTIFLNRALYLHPGQTRYPPFEFRVYVLYVVCTHRIYERDRFKEALNKVAIHLARWRLASPSELIPNSERIKFQEAPWKEKPVVYITDHPFGAMLTQFFKELSSILPIHDLNEVVSFFPNNQQTVMVGLQNQVEQMIDLFKAVIGTPIKASL